MRLDGPVCAKKKGPDSATVRAAVAVIGGADTEILDSVGIDVSYRANALTEIFMILKGPGERSCPGADLLVRLDRAIRAKKEEPDGAAVGAAVVVIGGADGEILDPVAIQVPERGSALPKFVMIIQDPSKPPFRGADLLVRLYLPRPGAKPQGCGEDTKSHRAAQDPARSSCSSPRFHGVGPPSKRW